ncbi:MAG: 2-oxoglutarate dehydrogenase complex dihydrolipoyllysine-residue succinyltransferase [Deltaproteobacteria bacterium]|nr:2-oxoglutarate dehydrogenase complex dihydrolipoyllysine-residue succinyltransferase [Deltaproteobacteria bacterium]
MVNDRVDLAVPWLGESVTEALIGRWLKGVGEAVRPDEPVAELETDKVNVQLPAPAAGVLSEQVHPAGATVKVGEVIGRIATSGAATAAAPAPRAAPAAAAPAPAAPRAPAAPPPEPERLTPSKRKALRESGPRPEAAAVPAAGPEPLSVEARPAPREAPRAAPSPAVMPPHAAARGPAEVLAEELEEVVPMSPLRKRIAERLVQAQHSAAILTTFNEVDMTSLQALRSRFGEQFLQKHGVKLGLMSFFTKACIAALRELGGLNAEVRDGAIVYKRHYDIGIAIGSGRGLVVPVIRGADRLSFAQIEKAIDELQTKVQENRLTLEDLAGGTFTITNGGVYGSLMSTPLLNPPQTGILGMHKIVKRPVAVGDEIRLRPMMYVALSYDHRVVDGRESVQFLIAVKQRLEEPDRLMFEL